MGSNQVQPKIKKLFNTDQCQNEILIISRLELEAGNTMELLEAMEYLRETWLYQYLHAIPTPTQVLAILNPLKSLQYIHDYIILVEALRDYKNEGSLSGRVGLRQLCQYRMLVFFATMSTIHHIVLLNLDHPSHWFQMIIDDYVGLFHLPRVVLVHHPLSVMLYLKTLNFFFWKIVRFSIYELIRDLLAGQNMEHPFMLKSSKLRKLRNNTIKIARMVQFFGIFCDLLFSMFTFILIVTYLTEYSIWNVINCLGLASMLTIGASLWLYSKAVVSLYSSAIPLAYFLICLVDIRLFQNNKLLKLVPMQHVVSRRHAAQQTESIGVPELSLIRFRINHIESIRFFLIICPDFSAIFMYNLVIVYSSGTSLMATFFRQPKLSVENALILSVVISFIVSFGAFHLMIANQSGGYKRIRTSLRLAMFGQEFHTKRRYGLQYGPLGLVNMAAFGKSIFLFIKLFFICFRKG